MGVVCAGGLVCDIRLGKKVHVYLRTLDKFSLGS